MIKYRKIFSSLFLTSALFSPLRAQAPLGGEISTNEITGINIGASGAASEAAVKASMASHTHKKHKEHKQYHGNKLKSMNVAGSVKSFLMNVEGLTVECDITFDSDKLPGFANTPDKTFRVRTPLSTIQKFVMNHIDNYRLELGFSGKLFQLSLKPIKIQKIDKKTVRITIELLEPKNLQGLLSDSSDLQGLYYFQHELKKNKTEARPFARLVDYSADGKEQGSFKDRKTFSVFVREGAILNKAEKHGKIEHSVIFKGVEGIVSTSVKGEKERLEPNEFVKLIGHGKHPFTPNGNFFILKEGKPKQCSMTFDKATVEGDSLTFMVSSLNNGKASKADAAACFDGKSTTYESPIIVFLDYSSGGTK